MVLQLLLDHGEKLAEGEGMVFKDRDEAVMATVMVKVFTFTHALVSQQTASPNLWTEEQNIRLLHK